MEKPQDTNHSEVCRQCGLCLPCLRDIDIPKVFSCEQFATTYRQLYWAAKNYAELEVKGDECIRCGICERCCPYSIDISEGMARVHDLLNVEISLNVTEKSPRMFYSKTFTLDKIKGPHSKDRDIQEGSSRNSR